MKTAAVSLFQYCPDGDESVDVNPDPPMPNEARPFHVVIRSAGWIPVSILVFARDEEHALSRVQQALITCRDKQRLPEFGEYDVAQRVRERAQLYLDAISGTGLDHGKPMWLEVRPLDVGLICAKVEWAANGGLL